MVATAGAMVRGAETVVGVVLVGTEDDDAVMGAVMDEGVEVAMEGVGVRGRHSKQFRSYHSRGSNCCALSADRR
jgi:hypothetical protein